MRAMSAQQIEAFEESKSAPLMRSQQTLLAVGDLCVSYGGVRALRGMSLSVAEGEVVAVLGQPPTRAVFLARPANVVGGLKGLGGTFESDTAKTWKPSAGS